MIRNILATVCILMFIWGCIPTPPPPYFSPAFLLSEIEGKKAEWFLLKKHTDSTKVGIALRIKSLNTLIKFSGTYFLIDSYSDIIGISNIKDNKVLENNSLRPLLSFQNIPKTMTLISDNGKKYDLRGCFVNIDTIFADNLLCNFIIIDDCCGKGVLFERDRKDFIQDYRNDYYEYGYTASRFDDYFVILRTNNYSDITSFLKDPRKSVSKSGSDPKF